MVLWDLNPADKWVQLVYLKQDQGDLNPAYSRVQPPRILDLFRSFLKIDIRHFSSWVLVQMTVHT